MFRKHGFPLSRKRQRRYANRQCFLRDKGYVIQSGETRRNGRHPSVAIIILNWNGKKDTLKCLDSVFRLKHDEYEVIVADNGSTDGSKDAILKDYPRAILVEISRNIGFSAGNNAAIRLAIERKHDYVLLLNNDTTVNEDLLNELVQEAESDQTIAALGARVLSMKDDTDTWCLYGRLLYGWNLTSIQGLRVRTSLSSLSQYLDRSPLSRRVKMWFRSFFPFLSQPSDALNESRQSKEVDWVVGCGMFLRVSALEKIGLLDEELFFFYEDLEWCTRARKNGYGVVYLPTAVVRHLGSQSWGGDATRPDNVYLGIYNMLYCAMKHGDLHQKTKFLILFSIRHTFSIIRDILLMRPGQAEAKIAAIVDKFMGRPNRVWMRWSGLNGPSAVTADLIKVHLPRL